MYEGLPWNRMQMLSEYHNYLGLLNIGALLQESALLIYTTPSQHMDIEKAGHEDLPLSLHNFTELSAEDAPSFPAISIAVHSNSPPFVRIQILSDVFAPVGTGGGG